MSGTIKPTHPCHNCGSTDWGWREPIMTRQKAVSWIRKLNKHYGLNIHLRMPSINAKASADIFHNCICLAKLEPLYDPRVIAHEYAHFLQCRDVMPLLDQEHDQHFETLYQECCLVLEISPTPTRTLRRLKWAQVRELNQNSQKGFRERK